MKKLYIAAAIVFLALVGTAWAVLLPLNPPPANQQVAIYDTSTNNFNEALCRNCHNTTFQSGVPTRHHDLLYPDNKINPVTGIVYDCTDCHPITSSPDGEGLLMDRNCIACHNGTAFYGNTIGGKVNVPRPHHNTTLAQSRSCGNKTGCHGSAIDNYNDGHYVPAYTPSVVTPDTSFKTYNATSGRWWGGCEACHRGSTAVTPKINDNNNTHHNALIGVTYNMPPLSGSGAGCTWCHNTADGALNIRTCEECHSVKTIHNIQYNYIESKNIQGYGHIGTNWDCKGCHAWYNFAAAPLQGAMIPSVDSVSPSVLTTGVSNVVKFIGNNFLQDTYQTTVTIDGTALTPTSITDSEIAVTMPPLSAGDHVAQVKKGEVVSRFTTLTVVKPVSITSAKIASGTLTIVGTDLGTLPANNARNYVVIEHNGAKYIADSITSWTNSQIIAKSSISAIGDNVIVVVPTGGSATATIAGGTVADSVTVTYPNAAGLSWKRGTSKIVTWNIAGPHKAANVKIELVSPTKGTKVLKSSTPNDGSQSVSISSSQATASDYKIRITSLSHSPTYSDSSDNTFTITR